MVRLDAFGGLVLGVFLATCVAPLTALAAPDYSQSAITPAAEDVRYGSALRFTVRIRNTGDAAGWTQVVAPIPASALFVAAGDESCPARIDRKEGEIVLWERGGLPAGVDISCPVTLVAIGSVGSILSLDASIRDPE